MPPEILPCTERTRFGTTPHSQKVVQDSDAYGPTADGEIKEARRSNRKPLAWLGFCRAGRSGRVPRLYAFSNEFKDVFGTVGAFAPVEPLP